MTLNGRFKVPIYECTVIITVSDNIKKSINTYLRMNGDEKIDWNVGGFCYCPDIDKYYVFFDKDYLSVNTINHEKSHLVEMILKDRDIVAEDEVKCYLDGFISEKFDLFFKKRKFKIKVR